MSNMAPQTPFLNRGIWAQLEQYSRDLVLKNGKKLYIITGPIYDLNFGSIGPNKDISVPSKEFKVIVVLNANQAPADITDQTPIISVVMPNTHQDGSRPQINTNETCKTLSNGPIKFNEWQKYIKTLEEVELMAGFKILKIKKVI
jgi:DNA/RNA endonuclease G (NUC1)